MPAKSFCHISKTGSIVPLTDEKEAFARAKEEGFVWLNYIQPDKEDLSLLIEPFDIHPLSIEDCLDDNQIPKIDVFTNHAFILFNTFTYRGQVLSVDEVNFFVGERFLVTVSRQKADEFYPMNGLEQLIRQRMDSAKLGPSFAMHIILDRIVDFKFHAIEAVEDELVNTEDMMLCHPADTVPIDLQRLRRDLLQLRRSLFHEREILLKICRKDVRFIDGEAIVHYNDIYDHLTKYFELAEINREMLTSLMQMNLSILSNKMTESTTRTNKSVRRLTFITTIFMPLTLLTGIGGMSEWTMMTGAQNWTIAYPVFMLVLVAIGVVSYLMLRHMVKRDESKAD